MAQELKAVGINLNFAPVVDINTNGRNPTIGARAYGNDEETVSKMTSGIVRGHLVHGIQPCVKHFPGHGDTSTDSHFALPKVDTPLEVLREREFKPFTKAFRSRCAMVMTAHIVCAKLDPARPATLSPRILTEILRGELRYTRLILSDDMEMKAITDHYGPEEAALLAVQAGCDLLLYRSDAGARRAYAALAQALEAGTLAPERVLESASRSRALKKECLLPYQPADIAGVGEIVGLPEHAELVAKVPELPKK
jgi:beta-N-acetylhexosaminidase